MSSLRSRIFPLVQIPSALMKAFAWLLLAGIATSASFAQTPVTWNTTSNGTWGGNNWTGGVTNAPPTNSLTTNYAYFNNATGVTVTTGTTQSVAGIEFGPSAGSYTLTNTSGATRTLTIGAYGIRSSSSNNQVITGASSRITLGAASTFRVDGTGSLTISTSGGLLTTSVANTLTLRGTGSGAAGFISTQITGGGSVTKLDSQSNWTLSSTANDFTGGVIIGSSGGASGGTLTLGNSEVLGSNNVTIYGGTLALGSNNETIGTLTLGGGASGTSGNVTGSGTLTLGGNVTYSATNNPNGASISSNLGLGAANRTFTVGDSSGATTDLAVSGVISGTGGLIKAGSGTMSVGTSNTYTGATTITQGTLSASNLVVSGGASSLGNASTAVVLGNASSSGTLNYTGSTATYNRGFTVNAGGGRLDVANSGQTLTVATGGVATSGTFTVGGAGDANITATVSGTGNIVKVDGGTLTLSANNTYTGTTTVTQGTLSASKIAVSGGTSSLGNATTAVVLGNATSSGTLSYTGSTATYNRGFTVNAGGGRVDTVTAGQVLTIATGGIATSGNFTVGGAGNTAISSVISGSGNIIKTDGGSLTLSGSNTYTGNTTISQGTLSASNIVVSGGASNLGNATTAVVLGNTSTSGTLNYTGGNATFTRGLTVNAGGGRLDVATAGQTLTVATGGISSSGNFTVGGAGNTTISSTISGTGALTKTDAGTLTLSGSNSGYSGNVSIQQGTVVVSNSNGLGVGTGNLTVTSGAALALSGGITTTYGNASLGTGTLLLAGTGGGNGALTNVSGSNTWTSNVILTGNATIGSQAGVLTIGTTSPGFAPSGDTEPSESGYLTIGGSTLTFTGSGNVVVNSRIRDFAGQTSRTSYDNPPLTLVSSPSTANPGNVVINMGSSTASVEYVANANSYTGNTTVQNGTLILNTINNAGAPHDPTTASFHAINGGLVIGDGDTTYTATVRLGNPANEVISHLSSIEIKKDGILDINSQGQSLGALTFTGGGNITVGSGTLYLSQDVIVTGASGSPASITGGSLSLQIQREVSIDAASATRTFTVSSGGNAYDLLISSTIQAGDLVKAGNGTLKVTGNNTYTGYTQVQNGILLVAAGSDGSYRSGLGAANSTDAQGTYVNVDAGTLTGNATMSGTLQLMGNITVQREKLQLYGTGYSGLGALNNLSGDNTWGNITEANTLINLAGNSTISSTGGTLTIATNISSSSNNALTFDTASGTTITVSGGINTTSGNTTTATVTKTSAGTLILSGDSSYKGLTDIQAGTVVLKHANGLGSADSGTQVAAQAELQLNFTSGGTISAEALTLNGFGLGNVTASSGTGALHNVVGNNTWGGTISVQTDSSIKADSGTTLTLGAIQNYDSNHRALTVGGVGNTTINGAVTIGNVTLNGSNYISSTGTGGTLTKINSGLLTFGGGATSTLDTFTVSGGSVAINSGTTVRSGVFTSASSTTTTINGTLQSYYGSGTSTINGSLAGSGLFQKDGAGTLVINANFSAPNLDLTLTGGVLQFLNSTITLDDLSLVGGTLQVVNSTINVDTLTLGGGTLMLSSLGNLTANTIYITANTTIDFGGSPGGTFLSSANLVISGGVSITVTNWVSVANQASQSTVWYLRDGGSAVGGILNPGNITLTANDLYGGTPLSQISFSGYGGMTTTWVSTNGTGNGWHQNEIRPTPEPATYGAIFLGSCLALVGWRRFRRRAA